MKRCPNKWCKGYYTSFPDDYKYCPYCKTRLETHDVWTDIEDVYSGKGKFKYLLVERDFLPARTKKELW